MPTDEFGLFTACKWVKRENFNTKLTETKVKLASRYPKIVATTAFSAVTLLVGHQEEHPACKHWVMKCCKDYLSAVSFKWFAHDPADATAISCFVKIQNGLIFLVLAYPDCPGKEAVKRAPYQKTAATMLETGPTKSRPELSKAVRTLSGTVESGISARPARNLRCGATFCNV